MLQVKSCKRRTPATPKGHEGERKEEMLLGERVKKSNSRNLCAGEGKEKCKKNAIAERVGKSEWRGEQRHASAPNYSSATGCGCAGNTTPHIISQIET